jgi:hypothetical protein
VGDVTRSSPRDPWIRQSSAGVSGIGGPPRQWADNGAFEGPTSPCRRIWSGTVLGTSFSTIWPVEVSMMFLVGLRLDRILL